MSRIASEFFAASPMLLLPLIGLLLFFAVFVSVCVRVYRLSPGEVRRYANLPLDSNTRERMAPPPAHEEDDHG